MNNIFYGDKKALETLNNSTICVLDLDGIRNIRGLNDAICGRLVYVENVLPVDVCTEGFLVEVGDMVRYTYIR